MSGSPIRGDVRLEGVSVGGFVVAPVEAGLSEGSPGRAAGSAPAGEPVADDAGHLGGEPVVTPPHSDRYDAESVEHERQSRLRRWQAART